MAARYYLGIDLGGTNVKAGVVDDGGHSRSSVSRPTEAINCVQDLKCGS